MSEPTPFADIWQIAWLFEQYGTVFGESEYQKIKKVASIWICTNPLKYLYNTIARYSLEKTDIVGEPVEKKSILQDEFGIPMTRTLERGLRKCVI